MDRKQIKFLHCSDIHLDTPFTSLGADQDYPSIRRQDIKDTFTRIIDLAISENVNLFFISGDLYEHNYIRKSTIQFINDQFCRLPDAKIFIIPGNHDPLITNSYYDFFEWNKNVTILYKENSLSRVEELDACIATCDIQDLLLEPLSDHLSIHDGKSLFNFLLFHGTVDLSLNTNAFNPVSSRALAELDMDYIALGHYHNRIDDIGHHGSLYNPGSPEPLGFDETGEHGVFLGTLTASNPTDKDKTIRFYALNKRFYQLIEVNVDECYTQEQILSKIKESLRKHDAVHGLYSLSLKGYLPSTLVLDLPYMTQCIREEFFYVKIKDETTPDHNMEEIVQDPGLRGVFAQKILSRMQSSTDETTREQLKRALYFGLEALEKGKVEVL